VLIQAFTSESEVMAPPSEEVEKARAVLRALVKEDKGLEGSAVLQIAELLRRKVNAKGEEVKKGFAADLLLVASPVWVKTPESGDKELGATICELGPSTNYKSQRARFMVGWLAAGKYLRGRKTEAGLTAGLEKVEGLGWVVKKGALPSADLSFIIVDNASPHALDEQIESRRDGIVSVAGIKSMEIWARTRLKLLNNPEQPFEELVYKCTALKMFDPKLVARFAFVIYTYGVDAQSRYDPKVYSLTAEEEAILDAARTVVRWNLSQETTYAVPLSIWPRVMAYAKWLERTFGCEDIPLLLRNIPYKLAVLAYSFALLEGEVEPQIRHYRLAMQWLSYCARDIELDKYAETQKALRNLSSEEYQKIEKALMKDIEEDVKAKGGCTTDSYLFKIVDYLVKHGKSRRDELAAYLEVDEKTVTRKVNVLKGLGLLRSDKEGYSFTAKGVMFVKRWLEHVPEVPDVSASGGQTPSEGAPKTSLSPESGDIEGIGDMEPTTLKSQSVWEEFHAVGYKATPAVNYQKTVEALLEYVKIEKTNVISEEDAVKAIAHYWSEESCERVKQRLINDGYLRPFGPGKFLICENLDEMKKSLMPAGGNHNFQA
jgi:DNA-binding transcriptional ArsR family regulator